MILRELLTEKAVQSTWISDIIYTRATRVLTLKLSDGKVYSIPDISRTMFQKWAAAPSKGKFFHQYIKHYYEIYRKA